MSAAPRSAEQLIALLHRSGLAATMDLESILRQKPLPSSANGLASQLVRAGQLTDFQARQLLLGKWRNLILGRYKVLRPIGSGGMGGVLLCQHTSMNRLVALKVVPIRPGSDAAVLRFHREGRAVASLDHPNIVRAYDMGQNGDLLYLAMEYIEGESLGQVLKRRGPLPVDLAAECIRQTALGLQHAHAAGWVHRDIKPDNLLLTETGVVKILDLGLARSLFDRGDQLTQAHDAKHILGTLDYLAPEQIQQLEQIDGRCDIYSLGATFFALLTGRPPFGEGLAAEKMLRHLVLDVKSVREFRPEVPNELSLVLRRMMQKAPESRYQQAIEVAEAVAPFASPMVMADLERAATMPTEPEVVAPEVEEPKPEPPPPRSGGRRWWALAAIALLVVVGSVLVWWLTTGTTEPTGPPLIAANDAQKMVGKEVLMEMEVRTTGSTPVLYFLNSEEDFSLPTNCTIVIPRRLAEEAGLKSLEAIRDRYLRKRVRVRGMVGTFKQRAEIRIGSMEQLVVVH